MTFDYTDIVASVKLDEKTFKRFIRFDTFVVRKKWIRPAVFSLILIAAGLVILFTRGEKSGVIAAILLAAGIILSLACAGAFLLRVNRQAARANLEPARPVYTITMWDEGVLIANDQQEEEPQEITWDSIHKAFRRNGCIYLYVTTAKAFLLPSKQADAPDHEVWDFIRKRLGEDKCKG